MSKQEQNNLQVFFPGFSIYTSLLCVPSHEPACHPRALAVEPQPYPLIKISSDRFRLFRHCSCFYYMTSSMTLCWILIYHLFTPSSLPRAAVCACSQYISWRLFPFNQLVLLCCALNHLPSVMFTFCSSPGLCILNIIDCLIHTHTRYGGFGEVYSLKLPYKSVLLVSVNGDVQLKINCQNCVFLNHLGVTIHKT